MSTSSPFCSTEMSGAMRPLILRADRRIADVGMDRIGEIDRGRAARQRDEPALRGEAEHLIVKQLELGVLEELLRIVARQRLDRLPQAPVGAALADPRRVDAGSPVLVDRMRGDAVFGDLVHLVGADLQLDALAAGADDGRVDRAVVVLLRRRDIVLEAPRHARPGRMRDADRRVTVGDRVDENAEAVDVGQLLEGDRAALHLFPDRIGLLLPALDLDLDAAAGELVGELGRDAGDDRAVLRLQRLEARDDERIGVRHQRSGRRGPRVRCACSACPCGRRAARRCRACPGRCGRACPPA